MATISQKEWNSYIARLRKINDTAADEFRQIVIDKGGYGHIERQKLIDIAYGISTKYGEASAALSAQMYDAIAELSGAVVPSAVPAEVTYQDVAKTVNGIIKKTQSQEELVRGIGRLVKMAGTDTILSNAYRDRAKGKGSKRKHSGAQVAWVPSGDTCQFCLMLASKGWQKQTEWGANNHSEHIHANCDCTYAVRFNDSLDVAGYDPDEYKAIYDNAEGTTRDEKLKSMRSNYREENKDKINAQKRAAYQNKKIQNALDSLKGQDVTSEYMKLAKPGIGKIIAEDGFVDVKNEKETAEWIHKIFGGEITLLDDNNPDGEKNPDYLWNGKLWDLKTPNTSNQNTIDNRIHHGIRQIKSNTGGIIIDFSESELDFADGIKIVDEYGNKRAKTTTDFIVKKGDQFTIIRVKK